MLDVSRGEGTRVSKGPHISDDLPVRIHARGPHERHRLPRPGARWDGANLGDRRDVSREHHLLSKGHVLVLEPKLACRVATGGDRPQSLLRVARLRRGLHGDPGRPPSDRDSDEHPGVGLVGPTCLSDQARLVAKRAQRPGRVRGEVAAVPLGRREEPVRAKAVVVQNRLQSRQPREKRRQLRGRVGGHVGLQDRRKCTQNREPHESRHDQERQHSCCHASHLRRARDSIATRAAHGKSRVRKDGRVPAFGPNVTGS